MEILFIDKSKTDFLTNTFDISKNKKNIFKERCYS